MKRNRQTHAAVTLWAMAVLGLSSCILESGPDNKFSRTLWECDEVPLGPFQVEELALEFMCDGTVLLQCDAFDSPVYGTYTTDGMTAFFQNLTIEIEGHTITFIDASGSNDTLFLRWRIENSVYPFTTPMHRVTTEPLAS